MQPRLAQDSLYTGLTLNMTFLCLSVPSDGITGMHHHSSPTWRASFLPSLLLFLPPHSVPLLSVFLQSIMMEEEPRTKTCNGADVVFPKMLICKIEKIGELEVALMYQFPKCCCNKLPQIAQSETSQISFLHAAVTNHHRLHSLKHHRLVLYTSGNQKSHIKATAGWRFSRKSLGMCWRVGGLGCLPAYVTLAFKLVLCGCFLAHDYIITSVSIVMWSSFCVPPYPHFPLCEFIYFLIFVTKYQTKAA